MAQNSIPIQCWVHTKHECNFVSHILFFYFMPIYTGLLYLCFKCIELVYLKVKMLRRCALQYAIHNLCISTAFHFFQKVLLLRLVQWFVKYDIEIDRRQ